MTAVDPEGRIRHPLDVFHSTYQPDATPVPAGYVATADGTGLVAYVDPASFGAAASFVPTYIGPAESFTVPANRQALFSIAIDNEGILDVEGYLVEVD